ncbi:MAG TPA: 3,4-dihydroxy-2-butanone-4-phosphate synthase, partial [Gemmatimonadetes bacterium]|nr:3,4-dihydroxy-2-butanone-4-phosphate synthase [Gemmatimonadota bacterium]
MDRRTRPAEAGHAAEPRECALERVRAGIREIRAGSMVILVDDEDRENEGDLCI